MIEKVLKFIEEYKLSDKTIIVGFSGGFDSICLLDIMRRISQEKNIRLIAAHYNHNWRGEASKSEQQRCKKYCIENDIEFYTETADENVKKTETEARELRYAFFKRAIDKYKADGLFTAHNFDDNAETLLYRIIKGTGIVGLQGILPHRECFYRPLLTVRREEIEKYCAENNLKPNIDSSNSDTKYKRNLLRCEVLPLLENINPDVKAALNNLAKVAESETCIINEYISSISKQLYEDHKINSKFYRGLSKDVKARVIYNFISTSGFDYDLSLVENAYRFIEQTLDKKKTGRFSLSSSAFLYADSNHIEIIYKYSKDFGIREITGRGVYELGAGEIRIEECSATGQFIDESTVYADLSGVHGLTLRTRREGDVICPLGGRGIVKLKKYLIDKKIPQHKRDKLLLLCHENEILWVAGVGLSDKIKTTKEPTHKLSVKYKEGI